MLGFVSSLSAGSGVLLILQVYIWFLLRPSEGHCQPHSLHHVTQQWQHGLWVFPDLVSHSLIALNYCRAKTQLGTTTFTSFSWAEHDWAEWCRQGGSLKWKGSCSALIAKIIVRAGRQRSPLLFLHSPPPLPFLHLHHNHSTTLHHHPSYSTGPWLDLNTNGSAKKQPELRGSNHITAIIHFIFGWLSVKIIDRGRGIWGGTTNRLLVTGGIHLYMSCCTDKQNANKCICPKKKRFKSHPPLCVSCVFQLKQCVWFVSVWEI